MTDTPPTDTPKRRPVPQEAWTPSSDYLGHIVDHLERYLDEWSSATDERSHIVPSLSGALQQIRRLDRELTEAKARIAELEAQVDPG